MAAVCGIDDDLVPTAALAVALTTVEETQRIDGLEDEIEENAPRVKQAHTLLEEESRHHDVCVVGHSCWENEDLSDPTSITAKQFRTDFRLLYVPFLGAINNQSIVIRLKKNTRTVDSIRQTRKG